MSALATRADVVDALGRPLDSDELAKVDGLIDEAGDLVAGHLYPLPPREADGTVPAVVVRVVSRMAARVLEQASSTGGVFGATSTTDQIGDYSRTRSFTPGTTSGGPWLSRTDRVSLRQIRETGAFAVDTAPGSTPRAEHTPACALRFGLQVCSCPPVVR